MTFAATVAFVVTAVLTPVFANWARRKGLLDVPNYRSSHRIATPRIGGVALVLGMCAGIGALYLRGADLTRGLTVVLTGAVAVAALGFVDDLRPLPALARLLVQIAAATAVVTALGAAPLPGFGTEEWAAAAVTIVWVVGLTNAYNFMDGIDGIAGTQALIGGAGWVLVGLFIGAPELAVMGMVIAGASAGFLVHNWQPARVFMGDAGSGFFGFLFAALPELAPAAGVALWACAALLVWPFIFDTAFTLLRRARRRENVFAAHRSHIYQRLVLTGRSHGFVTLVYAGMALLGVVAALAIASDRTTLVSVAGVAVAAAAVAAWRYVVSREGRAGHSTGSRDRLNVC